MKHAQRIFMDFIASKGLKHTPQRTTIVDVFFSAKPHLSTEELYDAVRAVDSKIGQATVYRTLKLLCEAGLAKEMNFGDGSARFEPNREHHDHLICTSCNKTIEFVDDEIERLQIELARKNGFLLTSHRMYLFGICEDCRKNKVKPKKTAQED